MKQWYDANASILMQSQLLERRLKRQPMETASVLQALGAINERTRFLTSMIDELLDISRVQTHRTTLERKMHVPLSKMLAAHFLWNYPQKDRR